MIAFLTNVLVFKHSFVYDNKHELKK